MSTGDHPWTTCRLMKDGGGLLLLLVCHNGVHHKALQTGHILVSLSLVQAVIVRLVVMTPKLHHLHRLLVSGQNGSSVILNGIIHTMDILDHHLMPFQQQTLRL